MTVDKRTVVLGIVAAAAVAAAATATAINHRSSGSRERKAVSAYIDQVNAIQNQMHVPLTRVLLAYRDFTARSGPKESASPELAAAARTLTRLDKRLAATPAPPQARRLRTLLIDLVSRQAEITREVQGLSTFSPRYAAVLRRAQAANAALGKALGAISIPKPHTLRGTRKQLLAAQAKYQASARAAANAQADAVDAYDRSVTSVLLTLRLLHPPPALAAGYKAQIRALTDVAAAGARLSSELRKSNRKQVPTLGRQFTLASREAQSVAAQRAQIAGVRAYNARARAVSVAAGRVQTELARLERTLP